MAKYFFVKPGGYSNNHRIFICDNLESRHVNKTLKSLTAWQDKVFVDPVNNDVYLGYETINSDDAGHITALLKSVFGFEEKTFSN